MAVIDSEDGLRNMRGRAKLERFEPGVQMPNGDRITATNVQDAIDQIARLAGTAGGGGSGDLVWQDYTPTIEFEIPGDTAPTWTINSARYCTIGTLVHFTFDIELTLEWWDGDDGRIILELPVQCANQSIVGTGKELVNDEEQLMMTIVDGTHCGIEFYYGGGDANMGSGSHYVGGAFYESGNFVGTTGLLWPEQVATGPLAVTADRIWSTGDYGWAYNDAAEPTRRVSTYVEYQPPGWPSGSPQQNVGAIVADDNYVYYVAENYATIARIPLGGTFADMEVLIIPKGQPPNSMSGSGIGSNRQVQPVISGGKMYMVWTGGWDGSGTTIPAYGGNYRPKVIVVDLAAWSPTAVTTINVNNPTTVGGDIAGPIGLAVVNGKIVVSSMTPSEYSIPGAGYNSYKGQIYYTSAASPTSPMTPIEMPNGIIPAWGTQSGNYAYFLENDNYWGSAGYFPVFTSTPSSDLVTGLQANIRNFFPASFFMDAPTTGEFLRITFKAPPGQSLVIVNATVGHADTSVANWNFDGGQLPLKFGTLNGVTIPAGTSVISDNLTFPFDHTKPLVVSFYTATTDTERVSTTTGAMGYVKNSATNETTNTTVTGYTASAGTTYAISDITVYSYAHPPGTHLVIVDCTTTTPVVTAVEMTDDPNFIYLSEVAYPEGSFRTSIPWVSDSHVFAAANVINDAGNQRFVREAEPYVIRRALVTGAPAGGAFMKDLTPWKRELWPYTGTYANGKHYISMASWNYNSRLVTAEEDLSGPTLYPFPELPVPPANDLFANAEMLTLSAAPSIGNSYYASGWTVGPKVGEEQSAPLLWHNWNVDFGVEHTIWYKFTAPSTGDYTFTYSDVNGRSNFDCAIWSGTALGSLTAIYQNLGGGFNDPMLCTVHLTGGATYHITLSRYPLYQVVYSGEPYYNMEFQSYSKLSVDPGTGHLPVFVSAGVQSTVSGISGSITPALPSGLVNGNFLIAICRQNRDTTSFGSLTCSNWTTEANIPKAMGHPSQLVCLAWRFVQPGTPAPVFTCNASTGYTLTAQVFQYNTGQNPNIFRPFGWINLFGNNTGPAGGYFASNSVCFDGGVRLPVRCPQLQLTTPYSTIVSLTMYGQRQADPYWTNTVLLASFDGANNQTTFTDESNAAHGAATFLAGAKLSTATMKFGSTSLYTGTGGGSVTWPSSADWQFTNQPFTIECYVYGQNGAADQLIMANWDDSTSTFSWKLWLTGGKLTWNTGVGAANNQDMQATSAFPLNAWKAVCVDFNGLLYRMYIEGVMVASFSTVRTLNSISKPISVGGNAVGSFSLLGFTDEHRVTKGQARYANNAGYTVEGAAFPRTSVGSIPTPSTPPGFTSRDVTTGSSRLSDKSYVDMPDTAPAYTLPETPLDWCSVMFELRSQ